MGLLRGAKLQQDCAWFYGIKIRLIINNLYETMQAFFITGGTSDTNVGVLFYMLKDLSGWVFGDKGYLMNKDKLAFVEYDGTLDFYAKLRNNTKKVNQKYIPDEAKNV